MPFGVSATTGACIKAGTLGFPATVITRGVLLIGAPGSGRTALVRCVRIGWRSFSDTVCPGPTLTIVCMGVCVCPWGNAAGGGVCECREAVRLCGSTVVIADWTGVDSVAQAFARARAATPSCVIVRLWNV